ncbi:MAG: radical SAM family heme chaperone HemW [Coriobacteriia bacterium]|nr:radical SAM family heme chaperone HemW [Coriobacteriia bacterium]
MGFYPPESEPNYKALYMHVPFCRKRCLYCDFVTEAADFADERIDAHVSGLVRDLEKAALRGQLKQIQTVYIGGGTPSFIGASRLKQVFLALQESLDLAAVDEFTVECNPDSVTESMLELFTGFGVNRVSLGIQSFIDSELQALGRVHDARSAVAAIELVQPYVDNISIDLMCGIPLQTAQNLTANLQTAVELGINHISVYPLTVEEGTLLEAAVEAGEVRVADDDTQADLLELCKTLLETAGFTHYEIASFARDGFQSRHNQAYWTGLPYLGLGRGAIGMAMCDGVRVRFSDLEEIERLDNMSQAAEDIMLGLRLMQGVHVGKVNQSRQLLPGLEQCLAELIGSGLIEQQAEHYRLSSQGWLLANMVFGRIWSLAE